MSVSGKLFGQTERKSFQEERDEIVKKTKIKIGPFRIYPLIKFRNIGYDDNVYYQLENPVKDYTATLSPDFTLYLLFKNRIIFSFLENPEYVYYLKQERERSFNNSFQAQLKFLLSKFVLSGQYNYENARRRPTSEFDYRVRYIENSYLAAIGYETPRRTCFEVEVFRRKIAYEDEVYKGEFYLPSLLNRREDNLSLTIYYRVFSQTFFFVKGLYAKYIFDFEESRLRNSESYSLNTGFLFPEIGSLRGKFSLGYKKLWRYGLEKKKFEGLVGDTNLTFRIYRFLLRADYLRDCFFSYWKDNFYFVEDRYGGGMSFYFSRNIRLDYDYSIGYLNYPEPSKVRFGQEMKEIYKKDQIILQSAGIVFRLIKNIGVGISINFLEWNSNIHGADRKRTFIGGYLTYEF
ncbi:MAG: outer membrane beta-barrel protein [Candidatus Aminicenantia bacterium]